MFPVHIPPKPSTLTTRATRRPSIQSNSLSDIFRGWFNPATVKFALLKPILPFLRPLNRCFHSHFVAAAACPLNSHPAFSWCPNAAAHSTNSSTLTLLPSIPILPPFL